MLVRVLSDQTPADILDANLYFIDSIGLTEHLSPTRSNGLLAMVKQIKMYALAYKTKNNNSNEQSTETTACADSHRRDPRRGGGLCRRAALLHPAVRIRLRMGVCGNILQIGKYLEMVPFLMPFIGLVGTAATLVTKSRGAHVLSISFAALPLMFSATSST